MEDRLSIQISAEHLSRHYVLGTAEIKRAVDEVSFTFQEGERVGLIGRNGAGKTTLLQMLAGIVEPTSGRLAVDGKVTAIFTIGLGIREDLSGRENIYLEGEVLGRSRAETDRIVDEVVAFSELGSFIDQPVRTYSTGMKARLAFSTIVHIEPQILIIDEALSVGDAKFAAKASAKMRELTRKGRILIVVSHSMAAIEDMCTRCLWIEDGRVRMDGAPVDVTRAYLDEIRKADDAQLLRRFKAQDVNQSIVPGWTVGQMGWRSAEGGTKMSVSSGDAAVLVVPVYGPKEVAFHVELDIERLDGIHVLSSSSAGAGVAARTDPDGAATVEVDFGCMRLNWGIYGAKVRIGHAGQTVVARKMPFEVVNLRRHAGGRSVLVYPVEMTVEASEMERSA